MNDQGITPIENHPDLAKAIGLDGLYFKREDLHPYGSHKGRSIPFMIDHYFEKGERRFAISSSGNAALAAALHVNSKNKSLGQADKSKMIELDIFVGNNVSKAKLEKIKALANDNVRVLIKERPLQALLVAIEDGMRSLRQSTDDVALLGYASLAEEIASVKGIGSVFIGTSSGTTAQALAEYFIKNDLDIQVHIVQTSSCHRLSESFEPYDGPEEKSIADAIVDQTALRKTALIPDIEKTGGFGWFATNEDISTAQGLAENHAGLLISTNSALSVAGAMKAVYASHKLDGAALCLICGD